MKISIIDYGAGNLFSVASACKNLGYSPVLTADEKTISRSDRVIFPGVGNAISAMKRIREKRLDNLIPSLQQPVLGICLGMQLMMETSDEGDTECLGILKGRVAYFRKRNSAGIKVPHMGWNIIDNLKGRLFEGIDERTRMYFVHGYYVPGNEYTAANSYYHGSFTAAIEKDNFFGCQFHPEKSGEAGIEILDNFLKL
ncbi:MAG: imidazole glycerol phosphate synthase subunit HisH [Bacteroidales bacterium]|nr:imidazole glycerol phosphate synthase subunit HisH [Bacteroidales bacterium]